MRGQTAGPRGTPEAADPAARETNAAGKTRRGPGTYKGFVPPQPTAGVNVALLELLDAVSSLTAVSGVVLLIAWPVAALSANTELLQTIQATGCLGGPIALVAAGFLGRETALRLAGRLNGRAADSR